MLNSFKVATQLSYADLSPLLVFYNLCGKWNKSVFELFIFDVIIFWVRKSPLLVLSWIYSDRIAFSLSGVVSISSCPLSLLVSCNNSRRNQLPRSLKNIHLLFSFKWLSLSTLAFSLPWNWILSRDCWISYERLCLLRRPVKVWFINKITLVYKLTRWKWMAISVSCFIWSISFF